MKGKKFLISTVAMSLALAIALGGAFAYSKVQSNADGLNCEESEDFRRVVSNNSEEENLLEERSNAILKEDYLSVSQIDEKLVNLGYTIDGEEVYNGQEATGTNNFDKYDTKIVKTYNKTYKKKTYKITEVTYQPKVKNTKSNFYQKGAYTTKEGKGKLKDVAKASACTVMELAINKVVDDAFNTSKKKILAKTVYDVVKGTNEKLKGVYVKEVEGQYMWEMVETVREVHVNGIVCAVYNKTDLQVAVQFPTLNFKGSTPRPDIKQQKYYSYQGSSNYGDTTNAIKNYIKIGGKDYFSHPIYSKTLVSHVTIKGIENGKLSNLHTMKTYGNYYGY